MPVKAIVNAENELDELLGLGNPVAAAPVAATPPAGQAVAVDDPNAPTILQKQRYETNPLTGAAIDTESVDSLLENLATLDHANKQIYAVMCLIRERIGAMTDGDKKTRRIVGKRLKAKVEMPDDNWNNAQLKEAYNAYPQFRDNFLRIETVKPKMVEVKKMQGMTVVDNPPFEVFRDMVLGANNGPTGLPKVTIEG